MTTLKFRLTNLTLAAAAVAAMGAGVLGASPASAANDGPWPEPPSCSNDTGSCTSLADQLAYECFFEEDDFLIKWCDTSFAEMRGTHSQSFKAAQPAPPPPPASLRLIAPQGR